MHQDIKLYEKRVVVDKEFPICFGINCYNYNKGRHQIYAPHWHEDIEIHYIVSGKMESVINQKKMIAGAGDLLVVDSNAVHAGYNEDPLERLLVILNLEALSKELSGKNILFQPLIVQDAVIQDIMGKLYQEVKCERERYGNFDSRDTAYRLSCKGLTLQLLAHLSRHYIREVLTEKENLKRMQKQERFEPVIKFIGKHYTEPLNNSQLAEIIHLGEDRFNHLFKECMGISPLQYVNEVRMDKAMHLLKLGGYTSSEVAELVGIPDYNHFGRLFRRTYGCTPSQILKGEIQQNSDNMRIS